MNTSAASEPVPSLSPTLLSERYAQRARAARAQDPECDVSTWLLAALLAQLPADLLIAGEPALLAASQVDLELVDELLARAADVHARLHDPERAPHLFDGASVLHRATDPAIIRRLEAAGADPNARTTSGETPLHHACRAADVERLEALLAIGARVEPTGEGVVPEDLLQLPGQASATVAHCRALLAAARLGNGLPVSLPAVRHR